MADEQNIHELRNELEATRWDMYCGVEDLSHQFDFSGRLRKSIRTEPWKWLAGVALAGIVAGRVAPILLRRSGRNWLTRAATHFARQTAAVALPLVMTYAGEALQRRQQGRRTLPT
jgi:hypothetical protein